MAKSILQNRELANLGKKFIAQIRSRDSLIIPSLSLRRSVHASVYEKNLEEHVEPTVVPDHVIPPQPEQYWGPNPQTGVFGPAIDDTLDSSNNNGFQSNGGGDSVLEQKTFVRSQENLDKPIPH